MDDGMNITAGHGDLKTKFDATAKRMIKVDVARYQSCLDGTILTAGQKEQFLQDMWLVIMSFVELGFEVHPLQEVCGKDTESTTQRSNGAFDGLQSDELNDDNKEQEPRP
ncbi:hypothetical protein [Thalassovita sp.]|uniref:hypothetical protein n=1 Tax=Thalassovita sp. TaxID=1979401 RepID=UPI0028827E9D|nr:hypothetical protein [Thalassovita sp.]MDF1803188.1 hypothetical protein [Thalassovita sp.]